MTDHPITPPPELLDKWDNLPIGTQEIFVIAAQWGADQELEACINFVYDNELCNQELHHDLRAARRPKPSSLKEQALEMLESAWGGGHINNNTAQTIRRALESIND